MSDDVPTPRDERRIPREAINGIGAARARDTLVRATSWTAKLDELHRHGAQPDHRDALVALANVRP